MDYFIIVENNLNTWKTILCSIITAFDNIFFFYKPWNKKISRIRRADDIVFINVR